MVNLVKSLKFQGVPTPIDGLQAHWHLIVGELEVPSALQVRMEQFTALGIETAIIDTELDIRMTLPETAPNKDRLWSQLLRLFRIALASPFEITLSKLPRMALASALPDPEYLSLTRGRLPPG